MGIHVNPNVKTMPEVATEISKLGRSALNRDQANIDTRTLEKHILDGTYNTNEIEIANILLRLIGNFKTG